MPSKVLKPNKPATKISQLVQYEFWDYLTCREPPEK